ncbi:5-oxoprolinase subunit PxpB [Aquabacter cavernae]|uniref:5-oxoprolinase subunit PxpB n=1 Tax=Aquabacter cavernae TaxID=2496029 RepID=UPI000F8E96C5|nr:5-oxoprolinase subunit PxpB [Aquabacter cavernae]
MMVDAPEPMSPTWSLHPSGDRSLVILCTHEDPKVANGWCRALARALADDLPAGIDGVVPAMVSVALHYAPDRVLDAAPEPLRDGSSPYAILAEQVWARMAAFDLDRVPAGREITIPVCYGGDYGPDLQEVADISGLTPQEVIALHTAAPVDVLAVGFAPGHPYVGYFDARLSPGRRSSPRSDVPAGTIGLANRQSVIYPTRLPGGWNLIGRTPLVLFDPYRAEPSLLVAGDRVRFVAIDPAAFETLAAGQEGRP